MKRFYFNSICFIIAALLLLGSNTVIKAQTTCTQNDPLVCASLTPTTTVFTPVGPTTTVLPIGASTVFTIATTAVNPTQLSVTSSAQVIAGTGNCVLVRFNQVSTATVTSTDVNILVGTDVITCAGVTLTGGTACVRICDPRITAGSTIRVRLDFNLAAGSLPTSSVTLTAFAVAALNTVPCPTSFVCLTGSDNCTPCDINFPILSGKIRVFFDQPILAGTPNPIITAAADATGTLLTRFKFCASADAATNVSRTFVDYCVYTDALGALLPPITTFGTLQLSLQGNTVPCIINLLPNTCPTTFSFLSNTTACSPCDAGFTTLRGKIRLFLPLGAGVPNPIISSVVGLQATLGTIKLCASTDAATNVARTFVDYCIYTNALGATLPLLLNGTITIGIQTSDCIAPTLCVVAPDSDGDGIPDNVDVDDDNDGIPDRYEFATGKNVGFTPANDPSADDDGDGVPNFRDVSNAQCGGLNANGICINYDTDGDGVPNHLDLDSDNDGLPDVIEAGGPDSNGDGRLDCTGTCDSDGDGLLTPVDINGSITDTYASSSNISELANNTGTAGRNPFVYGGIFYNGVLDTDGDTVPDFLDIDSDNDGIYDIIETGGADANGDGRVDFSGSFASNDTDGDGLISAFDADTNNDGDVTDAGEGTQKALIISASLSSSGNAASWTDGPTPDKFPVDFDSDILPNYRDLESDSDGINDVLEAGGSDPDGNGIIGTGPSNAALINNDGYASATLAAPLISTDADTDGDGRPNDDADIYQTPYHNGGGGVPANFNPDQDGDSRPNFLDLDSDNDGINDIIENVGNVPGYDIDGDGMVDVKTETDFDGIAPVVDGADASYGDAGDVAPINTDLIDPNPAVADSDSVPDYLDLDSDNDSIFDTIEGGNAGSDANGDGLIDCTGGVYTACDPDLDGILERVDGKPLVIGDMPGNALPNRDSDNGGNADNLPDYRDLDSESNFNGNNQDIDDAGRGSQDADNDGRIDGTDTDGDGIINVPAIDDNNIFGGNGAVNIPLPLTLLDFKATLVQGNVRLNWTTSQEVNVSHFEILRSSDGSNFSAISSVNAIGGAGKTEYKFTDAANLNGKIFYKLKMVDDDGRFKYSQIVMIRFDGKLEPVVNVSPNPVHSSINVRLFDFAAGSYNLELRNSIGQLQYVKTVQLNGTEHTETIERTKAISKGMYLLTVHSKIDNKRNTIRIVVE